MTAFPTLVIERTGRERAELWTTDTTQFGTKWTALVKSGDLALLKGSRLSNAVLPLRMTMHHVSNLLKVFYVFNKFLISELRLMRR